MKWLVGIFLWIVSTSASCAQIISYASDRSWEFSDEDRVTWTNEFPFDEGVYWLRTTITIDQVLDTNTVYGIGVSMLASTEIFWDGKRVGRNGEVGRNRNDEIPGIIESLSIIPHELLSVGDHEVLIKFSNYHSDGKMRYYGIILTDYDKALQQPLIRTAFIHIYAGFFLIIGLFYLVRFLIDERRKTPSLYFAMLCLGFFALIIVEYMRNYYNYPYPFHFIRLQIILGVTVFVSLMLTLFFLSRFNYKIIWILFIVQIIGIIILVMLRDQGYDYSTNYTMVLGFLSASLITIKAIYERKKDGWLLLATVLPLPIILLFSFFTYDTILYVGFGNLVLVNLISLARQENRNNLEKRRIETMSERLKLDLLKKNIQPHFINNSLTSAIDWIERSPEKGVEFLFALSKEFDILLEIAEKKLIPVVKEIELCQAHLEIMTFRKEEPYRLTTENIDEYELIPPAILLTIIENGITHQTREGTGIEFLLSYKKEGGNKIYRVYVNGQSEPRVSAAKGTGTKYIEARLTESYQQGWSYISQAVNSGWESVIKIEEESK